MSALALATLTAMLEDFGPIARKTIQRHAHKATGEPIRADRTWANLYDLRNHLAHSRRPDIDESLVRRFTWSASTRSRPLPSISCEHGHNQ